MSKPTHRMDGATHWDTVYKRLGPRGGSWHQDEPRVTREFIRVFDVVTTTPVIDVGGGSSTLVDMLIDRGFSDVSVLDVSPTALQMARTRLGETASKVQWLCEDLLEWKPPRAYGLWHDRAVFHFLVEQEQQDRYKRLLRSTVLPGGLVIMATFAPAGPQRCSGLPVARYSPEGIVDVLGEAFECLDSRGEEHITPSGAVQPFSWVVLRARGASC